MEPQRASTFAELLKDYPFVTKGLSKLGITSPLDLQQQLLSIPNQLDNLIVSAPQGCGKKLGLIILSIRKFANEEQGVLVFVAHSKDLSQELASLTSVISRVPIVNLFMEKWQTNTKKCIVIGSPLQLSALPKQKKDTFSTVVLFQADFLFGFGYGTHLEQLASAMPKNIVYQIDCIKIGSELQAFKTKWMKKVVKIDYKPPQQERVAKIQKTDGQSVHFFEVCEKQMIPITLYVTLKFGLVNPKVLILVQNLRQVYKCYLFLDRAKIPSIGLYNHENPIDLKFYCLSLWMNGPTNIMIASKEIYNDLNKNIFKENCKKNFKRQNFSLSNLATIICINLKHLQQQYSDIFGSFSHKPFVMTFVQNNEEQVECLQNFMKLQSSMFQVVKSKQFPISKKQLQAFKYRIHDVWMCLGWNKIQLFQKYDFKKKILKSPDLKTHFEENPREKESLIKEIKQLKQKINRQTVSLTEHIPVYLVPECLKSSYEQKMKQTQKEMKNEEVPVYIKKARNALKHVDLQEEDPEFTDVSRLKLISSRKRWKLQHGFKLKKKNIRKERKGIFENN